MAENRALSAAIIVGPLLALATGSLFSPLPAVVNFAFSSSSPSYSSAFFLFYSSSCLFSAAFLSLLPASLS